MHRGRRWYFPIRAIREGSEEGLGRALCSGHPRTEHPQSLPQKLRRKIEGGGNEHSACAAALGNDSPLACIARLDEVARGGVEIGKTIRLLGELPVGVPAPALVGAAPHMRDRKNKSAINKT